MSYRPIKNAKITIRDENLRLIREGYTNDEGTFQTRLLAGRYYVSVEKEGYNSHEQWVNLIQDIDKVVILFPISPSTLQTISRTKFRDIVTPTTYLPITSLQTLVYSRFSDWKKISMTEKVALLTLTKTYFTDWKDIYTLKPVKMQTIAYSRFTDRKDVYIEEKPQEASGLDPNDPLWTPEDGWTFSWGFNSPDDIGGFTYGLGNYKDVHQEDSVVVFDANQENSYAYISRWNDVRYAKRIAFCLKAKIVEGLIGDTELLADLNITKENEKSFQDTQIYLEKRYDGTYLRIVRYDNIIIEIKYDEDWIVIVIDYDSNSAKIYDKNKNLIAEGEIPYDSKPWTTYSTYIVEYNKYNGETIVTDVLLDWYAVSEAI